MLLHPAWPFLFCPAFSLLRLPKSPHKPGFRLFTLSSLSPLPPLLQVSSSIILNIISSLFALAGIFIIITDLILYHVTVSI